MRIIDVCGTAIRTVAVSPDGRFVAASADRAFSVSHWESGEPCLLQATGAACTQFAFAPDGSWVAVGRPDRPLTLEPLDATPSPLVPVATHTGGTAVSPDGRKLVAPQATGGRDAKLAVWDLPALRPQAGYDGWPPFARLAFSPNGDSIAGIWPGVRRQYPAAFGVRFARTGGSDYHYPPMGGPVYGTPGFVSFSRDSGTCAFGWEREFHVLDTSTGTSRYARRVEAQFTDAAFTGSGRHFATVDYSGALKLWDAGTWQVVREYDWQCGPLTCLAFTADGSAGVCGTADGKLVQFDADE